MLCILHSAAISCVNLEIVCEYMQDRLWEAVDKEWMDCLQKESVENLLRIPSGVVQVDISTYVFCFKLDIVEFMCTWIISSSNLFG